VRTGHQTMVLSPDGFGSISRILTNCAWTSNHLVFQMVCDGFGSIFRIFALYIGHQTIWFLNGLSPMASVHNPGYLQTVCTVFQTIWLLNGFMPDGFGSISRIFSNGLHSVSNHMVFKWFLT
jgi:hypothetical protein